MNPKDVDLRSINLNIVKMDYSLAEHIRLKHGNSKKAFADFVGVKPQQVTTWINMGCIVHQGQLYSPRRRIDQKATAKD